MVAATILKNPKSRYLHNGLTERHKIWHGDTIRYLWCVPQLEICNFKNPTWRRPPFWKIEKSPYLGHSFSNFNKIWQGDAVWHLWPFGPIQIWNLKKSKMAAADIRNFKITISRQRLPSPPNPLTLSPGYVSYAQHLAWWRILDLRTRPAVENSNF